MTKIVGAKIAVLGDGLTGQAVRNQAGPLGYRIAAIEDADLIVASPGIPPTQYPNTAREIISEVEFTYRLWQEMGTTPQLIGITGTNGKSTVTSLIAHILGCPAAGNIGAPLINFVGQKMEVVSIELSSYQLEGCKQFCPDIAVYLNLEQDHLERHGTMESYRLQKAKLFQNQKAKDKLIYFSDDANVSESVKSAGSQKVPYSASHSDFGKFRAEQLPGEHNKLNVLAAALVARHLGVNDEKIASKLHKFVPLEHRIEKVLTYEGRIIYNDSKATNPHATLVAIDAFDSPIQLILCGKDKGLDLREFFQSVSKKVKSIVAFGDIAHKVEQSMQDLNTDLPVHLASNMELALEKAIEMAQSGDIILFSPSSASFDEFRNFEERGAQFKDLVIKKYAKSI